MQQLIGREDFENLLRSLAGALFQEAESHTRNQSWTLIFLDVRFDHQGGFDYKIRTVKPGNSVVITLTTPMTLLVVSLNSMRQQLTQDMWYGFCLTVRADQQCDMVYNYDQNCADDLTFYSE